MSDNVKPKPLFARLTLPANAVDVTADAAITAVIGAGRYTLPAFGPRMVCNMNVVAPRGA
jgi:hypothetical protein